MPVRQNAPNSEPVATAAVFVLVLKADGLVITELVHRDNRPHLVLPIARRAGERYSAALRLAPTAVPQAAPHERATILRLLAADQEASAA